jgi:hypothetical protein
VWRPPSRKGAVGSMNSLAFLAPDLVRAAIEGRLPRGIGVTRLRDAPAEWSRQHAMLGLPHQQATGLTPHDAGRERDFGAKRQPGQNSLPKPIGLSQRPVRPRELRQIAVICVSPGTLSKWATVWWRRQSPSNLSQHEKFPFNRKKREIHRFDPHFALSDAESIYKLNNLLALSRQRRNGNFLTEDGISVGFGRDLISEVRCGRQH